MIHLRIILSILLVSVLSTTCRSDSKAIRIGQAKPSWSDLPGVDDGRHSLVDLKHKEAVVVAFTCNHCPIAIEYYERMNEFATKHCGTGGKVALVAISVSNLETDKLPRMKELSQRRTLQFPYLHDQTQRAAKDFGATTTPQFCVLDQDRILVYRGAWDDDLNPTKVRNRYIEDAVTAVLKRQRLAVNETKAVGCPIDYE